MPNLKMRIRALWTDVRGGTLMLPAIGAMVLVGSAGLGVDTVQWYLTKRALQQAVDSSALAGGQALQQEKNSSASALRELGRNTNVAPTVELMSNPPVEGGFAGNREAMEVVASTRRALPFSSMFMDPPTIRARAVAASVVSGRHCILALARDDTGVSITGSVEVDLECGIASNSRAIDAIDVGGGSYITASPISAVGGIEYDDRNIDDDVVFIPFSSLQRDPIAARDLAVPATPAQCTATGFSIQPNETRTIGPGRYCNGMDIKGTLTLLPGVYIIDGGNLKVNSQAVVRGEGVTFVLTGRNRNNIATIDISGGASLDLRAPSDVENLTWESILIYQDAADNSPMSRITGGSSFDLEGVVYLPDGDLRFSGNSNETSTCLLLIANRIHFVGDSRLTDECPDRYDAVDMGTRRVRVVE